jgi:hypothetical protein
MPDLDRLKTDLPAVSAEEKKLQADRQKAADDYNQVSREIDEHWEHIKAAWWDQAITSSPLMSSMRWIDEMLKQWEEKATKAEAASKEHPASWTEQINPFSQKGADYWRAQKQAAGVTESDNPVKDWWDQHFGGGATPGSASAPPPATSTQRRPGGRMKLGGGAVPLMGGLAPDEWPESTNIEDRRGEGGAASLLTDDAIKTQNELMEQTKRLAEDFERLFADYGGAAGLAGLGGAGGAAPGSLAAQAGLNDIGGAGGAGGGAGGPLGIFSGGGLGGRRGGGSVPGMGGLPGFGGGGFGGRRRGGGGNGDNATDPGGGDGGGSGDPTATGSAFLASQRARIKDEIEKNPELRLRAAAITKVENEGAGPAVLESAMNRAIYTGRSLTSILASGPKSFYGPGRTGQVEREMEALRRNPKYFEKLNALTNQALGGSNVTQGYTDQGSAGDPNYGAGGVGVNINRERFNLWGGGPGGHAGAEHFREQQQARVRGEAAAAAAASADQSEHRNRFIEAIRNQAKLGVAAPRNSFTSQAFAGRRRSQAADDTADDGSQPTIRSQEEADDWVFGTGASRAEIDNQMAQKVEGTGKLSVHVNAPRGTKVGAEGGGLFKKTEVTRQTQMEPAASSMASQYQE